MKKQNWFGDKARLFILSLAAGLLFSSTGYSQDAAKDCACTKKIQNGPVITFLNVSEYSQTNPNYVMLTDCVDGDKCEGTCTWAYNEGVHGWKIENGECMEWPDVEPVDGQKSNPYMRTEIMTSKSDVFGFYPNPASGSISIKSTVDSEKITTIIHDLTGAEVMRSAERMIDISELSSGTYVISISDGVNLQREKLIVE